MSDNSGLYWVRHNAKLEVIAMQRDAEFMKQRPFMMLRPRIFPDGNQWCALYGDNLQDGVCAFGDTPELAAAQFDIEWKTTKARAMK